MDQSKCFKDFFGSISEDRTIVLILFLIRNDKVLLTEGGFLKSDVNRLCREI